MAPRKKKAAEVKPLTIEESRRVQGSAAELEKFKAAQEKKKQQDALPSGEDIKASPYKPKTKAKGKKRKSWVGDVSNVGVDTTTNILKPTGEQTSAERDLIAKQSDGDTKATGAAVLPGPAPRPGRSILPAGVVPAKNRDLKKGVVAKTVKTPKRKRKRKSKFVAPAPAKVGQAGTVGGKVVRVTPENIDAVNKEKLTTVLPDAGRDVMTPVGRPEVEGVILPPVLKGARNGTNMGGFAGKYSDVHAAVHEALGHLVTMANSPKGSPEHHAAHEAFNVLHAQIGQIGNKGIHRLLGLARQGVQENHGSDKIPTILKTARGVILGKLEEGKQAAAARAERSGPAK